ncbi:hypothetical protein [Pyxidicoccus sp. MSG2]|uniref:hypothetical protein n=1 Tax=Pyxidicoccus sp. MSG2 TaxID=2996790 RepID=UPI002270F4D6|nr:hypothetical protein [Pyxidicoccus sp. MSG2]MCY1017865.1 hypothetical protein [Pyxidicoccus sp. MSG2]
MAVSGVWGCAVALLLPVCWGCATGGLQPGHFDFVTIVEKTELGPDGWRAACVHALMENMTTRESFVCKFGVEMPMETEQEGSISRALAQRIAADCATVAAERVFRPATAALPPGLACESFKKTYQETLYGAVQGSIVRTTCHKKTTPVKVGF